MKKCKDCDKMIPNRWVRCKECRIKFKRRTGKIRHFILNEAPNNKDIALINSRIFRNILKIKEYEKNIDSITNQNELLKTRRTMLREMLKDKKKHWQEVKEKVLI